MIKLVTFLKRRPDLTRPQFKERWLTVHAPIASVFPGLRGYMLGFSLEAEEPKADGVAQLWFESRRGAQASYASEIGRNGSADANAYLARREHLLVSEEWVSRSAPLVDTPFKLLIAAKRRPEVPRLNFVDSWRELGRGPVGERCGSGQVRLCYDEAGELLNSRTSGALDLIEGEAVFDGMLELWFASEEALRAGYAAYLAGVRSTLASEVSSLEEALLEEHVVVTPPDGAYNLEAGI
jgi:uncharacterized protein (TIGR02118 family)